MATPVIIEVKANASQAKRELNSIGASMKSFGSSIRSVIAMSSQAVTGVRQMAQGLQNLGFTMSAMIGLPVAAAMKNIAEEATSFEKAMVEVEKTTGIAKKEIMDLGEQIRDLAMTTPTSARELANLAAEAGRAGVGLGNTLAGNIEGAKAEILEFVRVMDMMQVSTTLTGTESAKAFSRIITLFDEIDTTNIENLGSAINELGQATSVSEDEIVGAMLRIAPAAVTLDMTAAQVAGLATAITQMSESMSRGGTSVRVALDQMAINYEEAAKLIGVSTEEMKSRMNDEALPVFMELVYAMGQIDDATTATAVAVDIFGTTGGKAVRRFAEAYPELLELMALSSYAFEEGTSLQTEFNRALTATASQFDILKNAITEAGLRFADDLLPIAQEIISALIPAVQELADWVGNLTVEQKMLAVGIAALVTVGLPLLALLGSIGFGFSMIINGAVNLIGGIVGLTATVLTFGGGLASLSTIITALAALVGGVLVAKLIDGGKGFDVIMEKLREVASGAFDWGENLIANIAEGIVSSAATVLVNALEFVGNIISSFLEGHSPPDVGPLSTIGEWGARLIDTYLRGFFNADFSVLKKVSGIISDVLQTFVDIGRIQDIDFGPMLASARTFVAEFINTFNKTGVISESILSKISSMLGETGDEITKLLRLQMQYNQAVKELDRIRQSMTDIEESYSAEARAIAARTDLTEAEKMVAIRSAKKRRDLALTNAATERDVAQDNVDSLKDEVSWQEQYIGAMQDQDDVLTDHMKVINKLTKAIKSVGNAVKSLADKIRDLIADLLKQLALNERLKELYESKGMDTTPLLREELSLRKRLVKALMEKKLMFEEMNKELPESDWLSLSAEEEAMISTNLDRIQELESYLDSLSGAKSVKIPSIDTSDADKAKDAIDDTISQLSRLGSTVSNVLAEGPKFWEAFKAGLTGGTIEPIVAGIDPKDAKGGLQEFGQMFIPELDSTSAKFYEWGQKIKEVIDKVKTKIEELTTAWETAKTKITTTIDNLKGSVDRIFSGGKVGATAGDIVPGIQEFGQQFIVAEDATMGFGEKIKKLLPILAAGGAALFVLRGPLLKLLGLLAGTGVVGKFGSAIGGLVGPNGPLGSLAEWATESLGIFPKMKSGLGALTGVAGKAKSGFVGMGEGLARILGVASKKVVTFINLFGAKGGIKGAVAQFGGLLKSGVGKGLTGVLSLAKGGIGTLIGSIASSIGPIVATIVKFIGAFTAIGGAVIAAIIAVVATIKYMKDHWEDFKDSFIEIWDNIKSAIKGFVDSFKKALGITGEKGIDFKKILDDIYKKAEPVAKFLAGAFTKALLVISGLLKTVLPAVGKAIGGIFKGITWVASGILDVLSGIFKFFEGLWHGISDGDWSMLTDAWEKIKEGAKEIFGGIAVAIGGVFSGIYDVVVGVVRNIIDSIKKAISGNKFLSSLFGGIGEWFNKVKQSFQPVIDTVKNVIAYVKKAYKIVKSAFSFGGAVKGFAALANVIKPLKKVLGPVLEVFWRLWKVVSPLIEAFKSGFAEGGFKGAFEKIKEILPEVLGNLWKLLGSLVTMVPKMLSGIAQMLWPWIQNTLIPWVMGVVNTVWEYLKTNVPIWVTAILAALGVLVAKLWLWITETLIPWVTGMISQVWTYIKDNAPVWLKAIMAVLETAAVAMWGWVSGTLIPWVVDVIKKVWDYLKEHGPDWIAKFLEILATVAVAIWGWITETLIPWIVDVIRTVADYIATNGPKWLAKLAVVLRSLAVKLWNWITTTVVPWLKDIIDKGKEWLGKIATEWWEKVKTGLNKIREKFRTIFESIKTIIASALKTAINGMISALERGINKVVDGINDFIKKINTILTKMGIGEIGLLGKISIPRLAKGGIAIQEQLAIVGDVPEAIIPLDRLPDFMGVANQAQQPVHIEIRDNTVRSEDDLQQIIRAVERQLGISLGAKRRMLSRSFG